VGRIDDFDDNEIDHLPHRADEQNVSRQPRLTPKQTDEHNMGIKGGGEGEREEGGDRDLLKELHELTWLLGNLADDMT